MIPALDEELYLRDCLARLVEEITNSGHRAEIIVVDNGSDDSTRRIACGFEEVIVIDEPHRGLARVGATAPPAA